VASAFEDLSKAVADVAEAVAPSVVGVGAGGSGVVVEEGLVATNAHNLRADEVIVTFRDGRRVAATVAGVDADGDLAVLSVDSADARPLEWAARAPKLGEVVLALANPGGRGPRIGVGFVSALDVAFRGPGGRRITGAIEHAAPLERGSSGGPLVDGEGRLVGIDTHRLGDGFYLALPAGEELKTRIDALARGESPRRVRLGVALAPPRVARRLRRSVGLPEHDGLLVHGVEPGGPAGRAGIGYGDLIVRVGGTPVTSVDELAACLERVGADGSVELGLVRGAEELSVVVDFAGEATGDEG
jgi:serine protease Do